ncbi:hypothetical protein LZC95_07755 [Pendulispora brunnea]|uniref:Uncharacterized protein n=1 Tax=Pendulispora brunnea TaxID=2905690 RepID=A0ABZ2KIG7_9BACT
MARLVNRWCDNDLAVVAAGVDALVSVHTRPVLHPRHVEVRRHLEDPMLATILAPALRRERQRERAMGGFERGEAFTPGSAIDIDCHQALDAPHRNTNVRLRDPAPRVACGIRVARRHALPRSLHRVLSGRVAIRAAAPAVCNAVLHANSPYRVDAESVLRVRNGRVERRCVVRW